MKLIYRIILRVLIALTVILSVWAVFFYFIIINEVYDEIDDNLEDYSAVIITRFNSGDSRPEQNNGTNNSYHIELISESFINLEQNSRFLDDHVYIEAKGETEPARVLKTFFRADDDKTYRLHVYTPSIEHGDLIESIFYAIIYLFLSLLITIVIINIWVYRRSLSPMYKILEWLKEYKLGAESNPLDNPTDILEFKRLNETIELSMIRVEKSYAAQREFVGNASHEMQTPLAICQVRLEALLETDLQEEQLGEIIKTQQTLDYMRRLNQTLLLLSKIENQQFIEIEAVNVNDIVSDLVADFKEVYTSHRTEVDVISNATLIVNMNVTLAKTLIINIIKNAFIHNTNPYQVSIQIDHSTLVVSNSGDEALNSEMIFKRFYQGRKNANSTGLGLSIVNSICRENKFKLEYRYVENRHHFSVIFLPDFNFISES